MNQILTFPIGEIKPYKMNPRNNDRAIAPVANSIKEFGFQQPIVVDRDMVVIAGHTRLAAAKSLGLTEVPIVIAKDLTEEQARAYRLADNRTNENAEWDWAMLGEEFAVMLSDSPDLMPVTGFNSEEIKRAINFEAVGGHARDEGAVARPDPVVKYGEVWTSLDGEHIVACTENNSKLFEGILEGKMIDMVLTDPPYNIGYQSTKGVVNNDTFESEAAFTKFLADTFKPAVKALRPGGAVVTCGYHHCFVPNRDALEPLGVKLKQELVWVKTAPLYNPGIPFRKQHENLWVGWKSGGAQHQDPGVSGMALVLDEREDLTKLTKEELIARITGDSTVRTAKHEQDKLANHPTVKPTALFIPLIQKCTMPGDTVVDIFAGSGVTALASYRVGRKSISAELDPSYVECILSRLYEHHKVDFTDGEGRLFSTLWEAEKAKREEEELNGQD